MRLLLKNITHLFPILAATQLTVDKDTVEVSLRVKIERDVILLVLESCVTVLLSFKQILAKQTA
jgi:hypothetical protein